MAWRITVRDFPKSCKTVEEAVEKLEAILEKDKETSKIIKDKYDNNKRKPKWKYHCPEFCNGIRYYGEEWDKGNRYVMIRWFGEFKEAIRAFSKKGFTVTIGG